MKHLFNTKDFFKHHLGLKIAALVCALVLFVLTPENQDLYRNEIFTDIPLNVTGEETLYNNGLIITDKIPSTIKITLSGRVSALKEIDSHDLKASVDLSEIQRKGAIDLPIDIDGLAFNPVEFAETPILSLNVDTMVTTFINLTMESSQETTDMIAAAVTEINPPEIKVRGSKELLDTISQAVVYFDTNTLDQTIHQTVPIHFFDIDGEEIDTDYLYVDDLYADIVVYPYKNVRVAANIQGEPEENYLLTQIKVSPDVVKISGDSNVLNSISEIETNIINIMGLNQSVVEDIPVNLPEGTQLSNGEPSVISVFAVIEEVIEKEIKIESIEYQNLNEEYRAALVGQPDKVVVKGPKSEVAKMTSESIKTVINMTNAKKGIQEYECEITEDEKWTEIIEKPEKLEIEVMK